MSHARNKSDQPRTPKAQKNDWGGWFVRCDIPDEHLAHLKAVDVDHVRLLEWEEGMAKKGYKLSLSYNPEKGSFVASATDIDPRSETHKGTLSAFAPDAGNAKKLLAWKFEELLGGKFQTPGKDVSGWG